MRRTCLKCGHGNAAASGSELEACPLCGAIYSKVERASAKDEEQPGAPPARRSQVRQLEERPSGFSQRQWVGFLGAAVLAVGVFAPLISGPMGMSMNYFANGKGQGIFVLAMAACTAALVFARRYPLVWATGGLSAAVVGFTFYRALSTLEQAKQVMTSDLEGNPFRGLADMAAESMQMQWGWALLGIGCLLVLASAWMRDARVEDT